MHSLRAFIYSHCFQYHQSTKWPQFIFPALISSLNFRSRYQTVYLTIHLIYNVCFTLHISNTKPSVFPQSHCNLLLLPSFFFLISINSQFILTVAQTRYLGLIPDASFSPKFYILWMNKSCHLYLYDIFRFQTIFIIFTTTTMVWVSFIFQMKNVFSLFNTAARVNI